jgi:hypothetical protein
MTPSLDWTLPIYTVPDERNPVPVRCEDSSPAFNHAKRVRIDAPWLDSERLNMGGAWWAYRKDGTPYLTSLPRLQNLPEETA